MIARQTDISCSFFARYSSHILVHPFLNILWISCLQRFTPAMASPTSLESQTRRQLHQDQPNWR